MSCGVALAVSLIFSDPTLVASIAVPPAADATPVSVAAEPLFADIVGRSTTLKAMVDGWIAGDASDRAEFWTAPTFVAFKGMATDLAELNMQGHVVLKDRGTDGDLKCILRGISEDMPKKVAAVETATSPAERRVALDELSYLLNDNVEVITSPPQPEV